jgi:hypothetical protein
VRLEKETLKDREKERELKHEEMDKKKKNMTSNCPARRALARSDQKRAADGAKKSTKLGSH